MPTRAEWSLIADSFGWGNRERESVSLVLGGIPRKAAAHYLSISLSSLQTYLRRAMRKAKTDDLVALLWEVVAVRDRARELRAVPAAERRLAVDQRPHV